MKVSKVRNVQVPSILNHLPMDVVKQFTLFHKNYTKN